MVIKIKARHFLGTSWNCRQECAIAKATKETLQHYDIPFKLVRELGRRVEIDGKSYKHRYYPLALFIIDKFLAFCLAFGNLTIRRITIKGFPPQHLSTKTPLEVIEELEGKRELWVRH